MDCSQCKMVKLSQESTDLQMEMRTDAEMDDPEMDNETQSVCTEPADLESLDDYEDELETMDVQQPQVLQEAACFSGAVSGRRLQPQPSTRPKDKYLQKLKSLSLLQFNGEYRLWPSFAKRFAGWVGNNLDLNGIMKLDFLRSCLTGEPLGMIADISSTNENFAIAWNKLATRYTDRWAVVCKDMDELFSYKTLLGKDAKELRKIHGVFKTNLKCLTDLDCGVDGNVVLYLLESKLDQETRECWEFEVDHWKRHHHGIRVGPENLLNFIEERARTLENTLGNLNYGTGHPEKVVSSMSVSEAYPSQGMRAFVRLEEKMSQLIDQLAYVHLRNDTSTKAKICAVNIGKSPQQGKLPQHKPHPACLFCKKATHSIWKCVEFKKASFAEKQKTVYDAKLCRNCLCTGHLARCCKRPVLCYVCNGNHHSILHFEGDGERK